MGSRRLRCGPVGDEAGDASKRDRHRLRARAGPNGRHRAGDGSVRRFRPRSVGRPAPAGGGGWATDALWRCRRATKGKRLYKSACALVDMEQSGDAYPGINAASLALLGDRESEARRLANAILASRGHGCPPNPMPAQTRPEAAPARPNGGSGWDAANATSIFCVYADHGASFRTRRPTSAATTS